MEDTDQWLTVTFTRLIPSVCSAPPLETACVGQSGSNCDGAFRIVPRNPRTLELGRRPVAAECPSLVRLLESQRAVGL